MSTVTSPGNHSQFEKMNAKFEIPVQEMERNDSKSLLKKNVMSLGLSARHHKV